ncbi:MAG: glycoside hydrolase family 2 TIM barrel-domain containing protein [Saprospiraceae bacterium]
MMKITKLIIFLLFIFQLKLVSQGDIILLNGIVDFEQTNDAFPPNNFTRKIQVPGLIDLAKPEIEDMEKYYYGQQPSKYNWYKFNFSLDDNKLDRYAVLKLIKSRYNTQIFLNGIDLGTFMQCNTPIEVNMTGYLKHENELLIRIGDRYKLPKEAATGFDREKFSDIPGIWDDVKIIFSGPIFIKDILPIPDIGNKSVEIKLRLENLSKFVERNMEYSEISYDIFAEIIDNNGSVVNTFNKKSNKIKSQSEKTVSFTIPIKDMKLWTLDNPYLYSVRVKIIPDDIVFNNYGNPESKKPDPPKDFNKKITVKQINFGMRNFKSEDSHFVLNGQRCQLFGSTITLNRFFEDPDRQALPWDREWVKKFLVSIPKSLGWNHFRVSLGLLPDFWYDIADENGIIIQNEYPMWNLRGTNSQYQKEYTDWIWSQGNHPSIVLWDALNEQVSDYMGNELIPQLKKLDPSRLWDAGWTELDKKDVDEIHWYPLAYGWWWTDSMSVAHRNDFQFGNLFDKYFGMEWFENQTAPIIVNEYGWLWLNLDGKDSGIRTRGKFNESDKLPSKINYEYFDPWGNQLYDDRDVFEYFVGKHATPEEKWQFQSYMLVMEGEILRSTRRIAGLASFAYISNDHGYTGDWFMNPIKELLPNQTLLAQYNSHKAFAAFIDLKDGRYLKQKDVFKKNTEYPINIFILNDLNKISSGILSIKIIDNKGKIVSTQSTKISVNANWQKNHTFIVKIPKKSGGYMIKTELQSDNDDNIPQVSRRYINVGKSSNNDFYNYQYNYPKGFPK